MVNYVFRQPHTFTIFCLPLFIILRLLPHRVYNIFEKTLFGLLESKKSLIPNNFLQFYTLLHYISQILYVYLYLATESELLYISLHQDLRKRARACRKRRDLCAASACYGACSAYL